MVVCFVSEDGRLGRVVTLLFDASLFVLFTLIIEGSIFFSKVFSWEFGSNCINIECWDLLECVVDQFCFQARPSKLLWVGGISPAVSKEYLKQEFLKFGKIEDFVFNRERNTASMEFLALEDALEAMKNMNGKRMGGDQIRVDFLRSHTLRRVRF